ncbi:MAG: hypothetical protein ACRETW_00510 [Stenotrophobium sp.]
MLFLRRSHPLVIWLALAALLYRALIPAGFMPSFKGDGQGVSIAFCVGGKLKILTDGDGAPANHVASECAFAMAVVPVLPASTAVFVPHRHAPTVLVAAATNLTVSRSITPQPPVRGPPQLS